MLVALDVPTLDEAKRLASLLVAEVDGFKVGLELITGVGPSAITEIAAIGKPVFADAKLHDIPNTVERSARRVASAGARWVTVHAAGGTSMIEAAVTGMGGTGVLAVTVLTSLSEADLPPTGVEPGVEQQVVRLAQLAERAGAEGAVCAPGDLEAVKAGGVGLTLFTPGIRMETSPTDDQKRVGTPASAAKGGSDYLIVGRPITLAEDPVATAREIAATIALFD
jgi:orotidine-5'-phosphate decarboxylase